MNKRVKPTISPEAVELSAELANDSERSTAIVGAELLNEQLALLLRSRMTIKDDKKVVDSLFRGTSPLSSFYARCKLAYVFGFIPQEMYDDLETIRDIRNCFAHRLRPFPRFSKPPICDLVKKLHSGKPLDQILFQVMQKFHPQTTLHLSQERGSFIMTVIFIRADLANLAKLAH